MKPVISVYLDGDSWCALIGDNIQEGLCGFGETPAKALHELANDIAFHNELFIKLRNILIK